jgi:hypothetical protein
MTDKEIQDLCRDYVANGNIIIKYKQGYKTIRWCKDNDPAHEPRTTFGAFNKTNPLTHKRWSYHKNK